MKLVRVNGKWIDEPKIEFEGRLVAIGSRDEIKEAEKNGCFTTANGDDVTDDDIFYYIEEGDTILGNHSGDFEITSYEEVK